MNLRCIFGGHAWPAKPPSVLLRRGMDEAGEFDHDVYIYRCVCERCKKVEYFTTSAVYWLLPWNDRSDEAPAVTFMRSSEDEIDFYLTNPKQSGGIWD